MKKALRYFYLILVFILLDAFIRSIIPVIRQMRSTENYDFWGFLGFYMLYFIAFQSWFYWPVVTAFYALSLIIKFNRFSFIVAGALLAYAHYLFYCFTTGDFIGSERFYIRSVQYTLFGGVFGAFRYHMMLDKRAAK